MEQEEEDVVESITRRWKVGYHVERVAQPAATSAAPPDIRSAFLAMRADLLRKERRLGAAPTIEEELADTIDELTNTRSELSQAQATITSLKEHNRQLRVQQSEEKTQREKLRGELATAQEQIQQNEKEIAQLKAVLPPRASTPTKTLDSSRQGNSPMRTTRAAAFRSPMRLPQTLKPANSPTPSQQHNTPPRRANSPSNVSLPHAYSPSPLKPPFR